VGIRRKDCGFLSSRFELGKFYLAAFLSISTKQFHTNNLYFSFLDEYRLGICELPLDEAVLGVLKHINNISPLVSFFHDQEKRLKIMLY